MLFISKDMSNKRQLFIFGDSFSAPWAKEDLGRNQWLNDYLELERQNGEEEIKDLQYWLNSKLFKQFTITNYAKCGISNDSIFELLYKHYCDVQPGDCVILQLTTVTRVRAANLNDGKWLEILTPPVPGTEQHIIHNTLYQPADTIKRGMERLELQYLKYMETKLKFIEHVFNAKQVKICISAFDSKLFDFLSDPLIYQKDFYASIGDKYPALVDTHPCYEGFYEIAERYINWFNIGDYLSVDF